MTISAKEISVAEKGQSEALQTATNHNKTLFPPERKNFAKCKLSAEKTGVAENNKTKPCKRSAAPASFGIFGESQFFLVLITILQNFVEYIENLSILCYRQL